MQVSHSQLVHPASQPHRAACQTEAGLLLPLRYNWLLFSAKSA